MLLVTSDKMWPNRFTLVMLPTKREIFSRTGQRAVTPNGVFTGESSASLDKSTTQSAMEFVNAVDSMKYDLPE